MMQPVSIHGEVRRYIFEIATSEPLDQQRLTAVARARLVTPSYHQADILGSIPLPGNARIIL